VIIFDGNDEAISFNDDSSPRTDQTGGTKVSINAQVDRGSSLDWFYKLLALFPDFPEELKSAIVVGEFNDLPAETRAIVWRSPKSGSRRLSWKRRRRVVVGALGRGC
jgi:hypothetical protein